jgi:hypothetical protein
MNYFARKGFNISGYHFGASRSNDAEYVFIRTEVSGKPKQSDL